MTNYEDQNNKEVTEESNLQESQNNAHEADNIETHEESVNEQEEIKNQMQPISSHQNQAAQKPQSKFALFLSSLFGGITVAVIGFILLLSGVIPANADETPNSTENNIASTEENTENTAIPISTSDDAISSNTLSNVSDTVVGVTNIQATDLWSQSDQAGTGSGVIYKKEDGKAYIVTNHHVVEGASELEIILSNGDTLNAELLGSDELTDLAVLTVDGSTIDTVATLGSSSDLIVGETAMAIGNPLGTKFAGSVTKGIISGLERAVEVDLNSDGQPDWTTEVIQTDAAINPGNSGGALIDSNGQLIGINSMKIASAQVEGIGFAIPIDEAKPVMEQLETNGRVSRPFVGISAIALSTVPDRHIEQTLKLEDGVSDGVVIAEVQPGSAADQAGLQRYDVITEINGTTIPSMMALKEYLYTETEIGDQINITYYREGVQQETLLTLTAQQQDLTR
ncbi:putative serine protease YyxA [Paraliobacillus quinghaiensis]|uniref:Serine protease YyxA n=1 Tax=Paraliobacillus quinghaiensis TaxID=470815 RepID=A0A917WW13_9BACI|nr:trypsin-like peptidase domain-containing protein [Paraliobacillus quinghaiensis]GGM34161.1 putative serine protease YyxA [Paraliobacillus quinghaiensis]